MNKLNSMMRWTARIGLGMTMALGAAAVAWAANPTSTALATLQLPQDTRIPVLYFQVEQDPGTDGEVYWRQAFQLGSGKTGEVSLYRNGPEKGILIGLDGATSGESLYGRPSITVDRPGGGKTVRIPYNWEAGTRISVSLTKGPTSLHMYVHSFEAPVSFEARVTIDQDFSSIGRNLWVSGFSRSPDDTCDAVPRGSVTMSAELEAQGAAYDAWPGLIGPAVVTSVQDNANDVCGTSRSQVTSSGALLQVGL